MDSTIPPTASSPARPPSPVTARRRRPLAFRLLFGVFGRILVALLVWTAPPAAAAFAQSASNGWLSSTELEHIAAEDRRGEENIAERRGKEPGPPPLRDRKRLRRHGHHHLSLLHVRPVLPEWIRGQRKVRVRMQH